MGAPNPGRQDLIPDHWAVVLSIPASSVPSTQKNARVLALLFPLQPQELNSYAYVFSVPH
jgi:hypothetical protein